MSSLFPQLLPRTRAQFRIGLIAIGLATVVCAVLHYPVPVVAVSVFGLLTVYVVYLREIDICSAVPKRHLALVTVLGVAMGVSWALLGGPIVARAYAASLGGQMSVSQVLLCGVAIPLTYGLALAGPAVILRCVDRAPGEPLTGLRIGALGALVVNAAATATLLVPQVAMGVDAESRTVDGLLAEAAVEGVAWPVVSLAGGGIVGIALWSRASRVSRRYPKAALVAAAMLPVVTGSVAMGLVDIAPIPLGVYVALQLLIAMATVVALRIAIAAALPSGASIAPAPSRAEVPAAGRPSSSRRVFGPMAIGIGVAVAVAAAATVLLEPVPAVYVCPPDCGRPPLGNPVETNPRFSGDNGAFSVAYPGEGTAYEVTLDPPGIDGVEVRYIGGDTGTLTFFGEPAAARTAKEVALNTLRAKYPGATVAYEIPNASVGYQPGYGVVADVLPRSVSSGYPSLRVIVMAAVKYDYALIATAAGPFHEFSPDYGTGHPSGANLEVALDMGKYVNSFRWNGDRYKRPS